MEYKVFLLTKEESRSTVNAGWKYAYAHKDRWISMGVSDQNGEISTYDKATTFFVYNNIAYTIFKDYLIPQENTRLFILQDKELATDRIEE